MFSFQLKLKPLSPSANKVFAVIEMLIMSQHAQIYCVKLRVESSNPEVFKVGGGVLRGAPNSFRGSSVNGSKENILALSQLNC